MTGDREGSGDGVKVGVVDDSAFMRSALSDILEERGMDVVDQAHDGESAVELVERSEVDVLTMDISMPGRDGYWAIDEIMDRQPVPIVVVSAHVYEETDEALELMQRGVVDILRKPGGNETSVSIWERADEIAERIAGAVQADVGTQTRSATERSRETTATTGSSVYEPSPSQDQGTRTDDGRRTTLVIASSTGGPDTVEKLLRGLSGDLDLRILLVQHMTDALTASFANRLDSNTPFRFREADDGDTIDSGEALVAKGGYHLEVTGYRAGRIEVALSSGPKLNNVRPAADATMRSAAACIDDPIIGVVLTGMGKDGAVGIQSIADAGGRTIAQDEATSRIFGMPKAAIETGAVEEVLPIDEIPAAIERIVTDERDE